MKYKDPEAITEHADKRALAQLVESSNEKKSGTIADTMNDLDAKSGRTSALQPVGLVCTLCYGDFEIEGRGGSTCGMTSAYLKYLMFRGLIF